MYRKVFKAVKGNSKPGQLATRCSSAAFTVVNDGIVIWVTRKYGSQLGQPSGRQRKEIGVYTYSSVPSGVGVAQQAPVATT
jgi:hypothetical protein